jgi:hypothetical protein
MCGAREYQFGGILGRAVGFEIVHIHAGRHVVDDCAPGIGHEQVPVLGGDRNRQTCLSADGCFVAAHLAPFEVQQCTAQEVGLDSGQALQDLVFDVMFE